MKKDKSHKERVNKAIAFEKPDKTPCDFAAVPEIWKKLGEYFGTQDREIILEYLGVDCRIISYDSFCKNPYISNNAMDENTAMERSSTGGMWRHQVADDSNRDIWGAHRKKVKTEFGFYDEFATYPLEKVETLEDIKEYSWPQPEWWDFSDIRKVISDLNKKVEYNIRYRVGSVFETAWSLYGFEKFLLDFAMRPEFPIYMMERISQIHCKNLKSVLEKAADMIDIIYFYDDIAAQNSLMISPQMYEDYVKPFHSDIIKIAKEYDKPVMIHCCGAIYPLIEEFINMGINILNPIQPLSPNMDPETLARKFSGRIAFHGGIDIQQLLPNGSTDEVKSQVELNKKILGKNGGYILAASHHIQADTSIENVLAMYNIT